MRKVELLPTRDCEAGYGPEDNSESDCDSQPTGSQLPPPPSDGSNSSQTRNVKGKCQKNKLRILLVSFQCVKSKSADVASLADIYNPDIICATET